MKRLEMVFVDEENAQLFDHSIKTKNFNTFWYNVTEYAKERGFCIREIKASSLSFERILDTRRPLGR